MKALHGTWGFYYGKNKWNWSKRCFPQYGKVIMNRNDRFDCFVLCMCWNLPRDSVTDSGPFSWTTMTGEKVDIHSRMGAIPGAKPQKLVQEGRPLYSLSPRAAPGLPMLLSGCQWMSDRLTKRTSDQAWWRASIPSPDSWSLRVSVL